MRLKAISVLTAWCVFASSILAMAVVQDQAATQPTNPDRYMFKGRLAAVTFSTRVEPLRRVLSLSFIVDDPYAMPSSKLLSNDQGMARVITDLPAGDLSGLTSANYMETFNGMLPPGVRLGEAYIVIAEWPGAFGLELKTIEPATRASEQQFLAEHKAYLLNFRWFMHRTVLLGHASVLSTRKHEFQRLIFESKSSPDDPTWAAKFAPMIEEKRIDFNKQREEGIAAVTSIIEKLKSERSGSVDAATLQTLDRMIADAEKSRVDLSRVEIEATP